MALDRKIFFSRIRSKPFNGTLKAGTVRGCNAILDEWDRRGLTDLRHLAYMLATARGECGPDMLPVREGFSKSDAVARAFVAKQGYRYAKVVNGQVYYGRGLVQLTHDSNYATMGKLLGIDLTNNPDLALDPPVAAKIMFEGMIRGSFTGKKLADYLNDHVTDFMNARRIINGTDKAETFASWARQFLTALTAAEDGKQVAVPPPPDITPVKPAVPSSKTGNVAGSIGVIVATGSGAVIANQSAKKGAGTGEIAIVVALSLVIAVAAFFVIRHFVKKG